jgi:hypothetical protein
MNERLLPRTQSTLPPIPPRREPGWGEILEAGFGQENDMVALWNIANRPQVQTDPNFNMLEALEASPLGLDHFRHLARARSQAEFSFIEARIREEQRQRETLALGGWQGFAAGLAAGVLSPTMFIPLIGPSRGARGVAEAFALAAGAATAQEAALFSDQLLRTPAETFTGIAAGTVLGGLLGSAAVYLRRSDFDRTAAGMAPLSNEDAISTLVRRADGSVVPSRPQARLQVSDSPAVLPRANLAALAAAPSEPGFVYRALRASEVESVRDRGLATPTTSVSADVEAPSLNRLSYGIGDEGNVIVRARLVPEDAAAGFRRTSARPEELEYLDPATSTWKPLAKKADELSGDAPLASAGAKATDEPLEMWVPMRQADGTVVDVPVFGREGIPEGWDEFINPTPVGRLAGQVSPLYRLGTQRISSRLRSSVMRISTGGLTTQGAKKGLTVAPGGDVESRINSMIEKWTYRVMRDLRESYITHLYGAKPTAMQRNLGYRWAILMNRSPGNGKLTWADYNAEASRALNSGDETPVAELRPAIATARAMIKEIKDYADEVMPGLIPDQVFEEGTTYFPHIFDPRAVGNNSEAFIKMVAEHLEEKLTLAAQARWERIRETVEVEDDWLRIMAMEREAAEQFRADLVTKVRDLDGRRRANAALDHALELEEEARDLVRARFEELEANFNSEGNEAVTKLHRRQARTENAEKYEDLMDVARAVRASLPEDVKVDLKELKRARAQLRAVNASIGRLETQRAAALDSIQRLEEMNLSALERLTDQAVALSRKLEKVDAKFSPEEFAKLAARFERISAQIDRAEARIEKMQAKVGTEFEPSERISIATADQAERRARFEAAFNRASGFEDSKALARQAIEERLAEIQQYVNRVNNRRAERMGKLRSRLDDLTPERAAATQSQIRAGQKARMEGYAEWLRARNASGVFIDDATQMYDFAPAALDAATQIKNSIMSSNGRFAQFDMLDSIPGFRKHRMLDIPYEQKSKFLEQNVENIADRYLRGVVPDIELTRAFGSKNFQDIWAPINRELDDFEAHLSTRTVDEKGKPVTPEKREKMLQEFQAIRTSYANQFAALIDRLRFQRGMPDDPNDIGYRVGRTFINSNVATMMGSAAVTSISDAARPVFMYGMNRVFRESWAPFLKGLVDESAAKQSEHVIRALRYVGIGVESYSGARATAMLDIYQTVGMQSKGERAVEWMAQMTPKVALFGPQTDINKFIAGRVAMGEFLSSIQSVMEGTSTEAQRTILARNGLDANYIRRIWNELQSPEGATKYDGLLLPNVENWTDMEAVRAWSAAMMRESDNTIIRPGLERALYSDANILGRLLFQFRSFTMAANSKMLMSGLQQRDMALYHVVQGTTFSLALGALSYYTWAMTAGERQREEMRNASWQLWMDQALYRSGILGIFSEAQSIGSNIPATRPFTTLSSEQLPGRRASSVMGAVFGPTFGKIEDIAGVLVGMDQPTEGTLNTARKLVPYQNVFYLRQGYDAVVQGLAANLGLPERREAR